LLKKIDYKSGVISFSARHTLSTAAMSHLGSMCCRHFLSSKKNVIKFLQPEN